MGIISHRTLERISSPVWKGGLRTKFINLADLLLDVSPMTFAELTTIYVKFSITSSLGSPVYAVAWIKNSKNWLIGLSLPADMEHPGLVQSPPQRSYKGLTKYFYLAEDEPIPCELSLWAKLAFESVRT